METTVKKHDHYGWQAQTFIALGAAVDAFGKPGERRLLIETCKGYGPGKALHSRASVSLHTSDGCYAHAFGLGTGLGDYSRVILRSGARCTEKAVRELHAEALLQADACMAEARAWYARQECEKAHPRPEELTPSGLGDVYAT